MASNMMQLSTYPEISKLDMLGLLPAQGSLVPESGPNFVDEFPDGIVPYGGDFEEILHPFGFVFVN